MAADVVPVIPLHIAVAFAHHRAADTVAGLVLRLQEAVGIAVDPNPGALIEALPGTGEPKYAPISGAEYLKMRLDATYVDKVT